MSFVPPITLHRDGLTLEPLTLAHEAGLAAAAADGELWNLDVTWVPWPEETRAYIDYALAGQERGERVPFAVIDDATGDVLGTTSYHDLVPAVRRVEIGHTWYAARAQRTHVNTTCKLMLMGHAFDTLKCNVVGWRTDSENYASQRAIGQLGAQRDGTIRCHSPRRDGTPRDAVFFSMLPDEWPAARAMLEERLERQGFAH